MPGESCSPSPLHAFVTWGHSVPRMEINEKCADALATFPSLLKSIHKYKQYVTWPSSIIEYRWDLTFSNQEMLNEIVFSSVEINSISLKHHAKIVRSLHWWAWQDVWSTGKHKLSIYISMMKCLGANGWKHEVKFGMFRSNLSAVQRQLRILGKDTNHDSGISKKQRWPWFMGLFLWFQFYQLKKSVFYRSLFQPKPRFAGRSDTRLQGRTYHGCPIGCAPYAELAVSRLVMMRRNTVFIYPQGYQVATSGMRCGPRYRVLSSHSGAE